LQTAYLHHNDGALPIVMKIAAGSAGNVPTHISTLIGGNQISISHRYFNTAMPETIDWEYLSAEQQAADLHAFYELLKPIYPNQWVGTGYSGGGEAALQYNYHYPDDLDATVVYATGLMNSHADTRLEEYVYNTVSTSECRDRISDFQRLVLSNKTEILSALQLDSELFDMPLGKVLEYGVVEFPYMFWMNDEHDCATIRVEGSEMSAIAAYLDKYIWFNGNNRENLLYSAAFYVDIYNEAGYFGFKTDHLADLMNYPNITSMDFTPEEGKRTYDPSKMQDMTDWLTNQGEHIIYVYGGIDPYTQAGIMPIDGLESFAAINPDASHEVNISGHPDKDQIHAALASWLGVQVPVNVK
ncbi:MAG: hypothetical protein MJK04_08255, partial [Psychrosphaera sp.]|nr:hypothetical protein [Psychrosphaera sp.]